MDDNKCQWYVTMDEYLKIVDSVIRNSSNSTFVCGRDIDRKSHPEDLMHTLTTVAESVALTLIALDQIGWVEKKPVGKAAKKK